MNINTVKPNAPFEPELSSLIGTFTSLKGMVYKIRRLKGFSFVILKTVKGLVQCVYEENTADFKLSDTPEGAFVIFKGFVKPEERSRLGFDFILHSAKVLSLPYEDFPVVISGKEIPASLDTLLDFRPLTLRHAGETAIFKIQHGITKAIRQFLDSRDFTEIHSPKLVSQGAEGGANIFSLDYFGKKAFLAQSPQFYKQQMTAVFGRVYEIAPVFRAEKHSTSRHINEYTSVDLEMGFIESFFDIMTFETAMLKFVFQYLKENCQNELSFFETSLPEIKEIPHIAFFDAKKLVSEKYNRPYADKNDLEPMEEKLLCQYFKEVYGSDFVFVTHYPSAKRPFYAMDTPENPEVTESFDLLFRGIEITTGGQRIHRFNEQIAKMISKGLNPDDFSHYLMAHKYGLPPHGGLGLGLERLTASVLGFSNIRNATLFPRDTERLAP